ncbi:MAG: hypothetical protein LUI04_06080 [Porphyromonadaceae bacterium]|nr:hypothetical protein [Porphyromonadaceae bacterium]
MKAIDTLALRPAVKTTPDGHMYREDYCEGVLFQYGWYNSENKRDGAYRMNWHGSTDNPQVEAFYKNGKLDDEFSSYYFNGKLSRTVTYDYGHKIGLEISWFENGNVMERKTWLPTEAESVLDGLYESFYEDGKPYISCYYAEGKYAGPYKEWDRNGNLVVDERREIPGLSHYFM